jgi:hypothetical protein
VDAINAVEREQVLTRAQLGVACAACPNFKAFPAGRSNKIRALVCPTALAAPGAHATPSEA